MKTRLPEPAEGQPARRFSAPGAAFSLLEVIIACAIFFMVVFAILGVVTQGLAAARKMQIKEPDIGMALVASGILLSNTYLEGSISGDFDDLFPDMYKGYTWQVDVLEVGSNSLFRVDVALFKDTAKHGSGETRTWLYVCGPGSPPGTASKGQF